MSKQEWLREYQQFLSAEREAPPTELSHKIWTDVRSALQPSPAKVFWKLAGIHAIIGTLTLLVCPQWGVGLIPENPGLMMIFMRFGSTVCTLACGAFFLGASALAAGAVLRPEEIQVVRKTRAALIAALAVLSLLIFWAFMEMISPSGGISHAHHATAQTLTLWSAGLWTLGAILGGYGMLELAWNVRTLRRPI